MNLKKGVAVTIVYSACNIKSVVSAIATLSVRLDIVGENTLPNADGNLKKWRNIHMYC